ncbi:MAG: saccharopine dehydrogenase NADP-binding domain-containing protein [Parvibaculum sp.]|uniref:saccharopine dehydrogenase family protein n=1 Tax=Parvibaculum sp. TaxID=2024848 RepID=UPI0025EECA8E|nr:saccharopine dehydrogenase NADP-binding domain-containing protein [Parvibaculum sp.]MCE9649197.1 saccharopine dehydrogenase NADP-binding domain-containing protein [Parvibaculum sp.]
MSGKFMIYGATGYTGKLVARTAKALGMRPLLAGRNEARLKSVAGQHGFEFRAFDLSDTTALLEALGEVDAVLHIAGPFSQTSKPMLDACLRTGTHYLDITGEIDVFEACAARDEEAQAAGIAVMPGVGFDVVPSDCLAAHMRARMPDAIELSLAISGLGQMSRGTAKTGVESVGKGTRARRDGRIVTLKTPPRAEFDFGKGLRPSIAIGWGDVSTAWHSTHIPHITVYFEASPQLEQMAGLGAFKRWIAARGFMQRKLKAQIDQQPEGPSDAERRAGYSIIIGEAVNAAGDKVRSRLTTPEGYTLTAMSSLEIVRRVLAGEVRPGFLTPSLAFGPDFIAEFDGCVLQDLNA